MSVFIRGRVIQTASETQNAGVFIGQNISDGWDSMSPVKAAGAYILGDGCVSSAHFAGYFDYNVIGYAVTDSDIKANGHWSHTH